MSEEKGNTREALATDSCREHGIELQLNCEDCAAIGRARIAHEAEIKRTPEFKFPPLPKGPQMFFTPTGDAFIGFSPFRMPKSVALAFAALQVENSYQWMEAEMEKQRLAAESAGKKSAEDRARKQKESSAKYREFLNKIGIRR